MENEGTATDHALSPELVKQLMDEYEVHIRRMAARLIRRLPPHVRLDELVSAGYEAFARCLKDYVELRDSEATFSIRRFDTYVRQRVRGAMMDSLREQDPLNRGLRTFVRALDNAHHKLSQEGCTHPTPEELARALQMNPRQLDQLTRRTFAKNDLELDQEVDAEGTPDERPASAPDARLLVEAETTALTKAMAQLTERERRVIELCYYHDLLQKEVADTLGLSEGRVSQLLGQARGKLFASLNDHEALADRAARAKTDAGSNKGGVRKKGS